MSETFLQIRKIFDSKVIGRGLGKINAENRRLIETKNDLKI